MVVDNKEGWVNILSDIKICLYIECLISVYWCDYKKITSVVWGGGIDIWNDR